jgi:hypothetical protein
MQIFQFIILTFLYSSTCFGHFPAHHQELNDYSGSLLFYLRIVVITVLMLMVGPVGRSAGRPDHEHQHGYHFDTEVKPEDNKLKNCCNRLEIYLN